MTHPIMYDDDDPLLARLRGICLALPETSETVSHGRPAFWAGRRTFASYGAYGFGDTRLIVRPADAEREALAADPRFSVPPYWGPSGWLALDLAEHPGLDGDWTEVAEIVEDSYRRVALKRMLAALGR
jgi:hypothetical protein